VTYESIAVSTLVNGSTN